MRVIDKGTAQGSVISPLLANIYLHYALDLWARRWRRREATGDMIIVRYADDFIVGFQHECPQHRHHSAGAVFLPVRRPSVLAQQAYRQSFQLGRPSQNPLLPTAAMESRP